MRRVAARRRSRPRPPHQTDADGTAHDRVHGTAGRWPGLEEVAADQSDRLRTATDGALGKELDDEHRTEKRPVSSRRHTSPPPMALHFRVARGWHVQVGAADFCGRMWCHPINAAAARMAGKKIAGCARRTSTANRRRSPVSQTPSTVRSY